MKRLLPLVIVAWACLPQFSQGDNWIHWRGPTQNGVAADKNLPSKWSPAKPGANNLIWKAPFGCRSTPLVMNGRVYIINDADEGINEQERVMCFDAETGKVRWEYRFNVFFTDIVSSRVGWASLAGDPETGNVYAQGVQGLFFCFDKDGKILWSHSLTEEYGRISGYGGRVNSPIVDGDLVIMGMVNASWGDQARGGNRFVAFDKRTGVPVWWSQPSELIRGTYSSIPVVVNIKGVRLLITGSSGGEILALKVSTGEPVWKYVVSAKSINISPVVAGTRVFIGHGEENVDTTEPGSVVCVDAGNIKDGKPELVWKRDDITVKYASPIYHDGQLIVCDENGRLFCLNANTGETIWKFKFGNASFGSPVMADGKIYVGEVNGRFHILQPGARRCEELDAKFLRSKDPDVAVEISGSPAIANGRIYFATSEEIFCIGTPSPAKIAPPGPPLPDRAEPNAKAAHLLVYPADVVLEPGQRVQFKVRGYDATGHLLGEIKPESWSLPAPPPPMGSTTSPPPLRGEITAEGELTIAKALPGQFGTVQANAGGLSAKARVRVAPTLPIVQDFKSIPEGRWPGGWINSQGKYVVVEKDGAKVYKKLAKDSNPLLARAYTYFSKPTLTDYTIQAEVMGESKNQEMPDMGIVNCRYTLVLDGNKQRLRLLCWEALPRVDKSIAWEWKPNVWHTMKLTVTIQNDKAQIRGKVWPRGQMEPEAWSIEFEDPKPNHEGSPALYGYGTGILEPQEGAAIFYANVKVTPNEKGIR
jgi:outer membrane protein assembly factor BamB